MQHDLHITTSRCTDPDPSKINETIFASNEQAESNVQISKESRCTGPGPLRRNEIRVVVDEGALPEEQIPVTKIAMDTTDANLQYLERMNDELLLNHMHSAPMCHDAEIEQPGEGLNTLAEVQFEDHDILGVAPCISIASENVDAHVGVEPCISIASENVDAPVINEQNGVGPHAEINEKHDITEEDIEIFRQNESVEAAILLSQKEEKKHVSCIDTQFETPEEAFKFYNSYALIVGFSTVKTGTYKSREKATLGEVTRRIFKCQRGGGGGNWQN